MSTCSLSNPASSQTLVSTLLSGLLLHHGRCLLAEGGSFTPVTRSISAKVIGTCSRPCFFRYSAKGVYFDMSDFRFYFAK